MVQALKASRCRGTAKGVTRESKHTHMCVGLMICPKCGQNIENSGFYEDFLNWIEQENAQGNLPILEGNKEAVELKVSTTGYAFQTDENSARYQIQLKLIYLQKGGV